MTQTLLIKNDEKDDFVKFNVQLPTGYSNFSVDSINGTIINQNYLKVGDKLSFNIQNNPITYDNLAKTVQIINDRTSTNPETDINKYPKLVNDIFKFYKLVYIPIYQFYDESKGFIYLFNPCIDDMLLDEPKIKDNLKAFRIVEPIGKQEAIYMSFCGQFVLGLKYVETESVNITLTIGESISNTKNKAIDEGAFVVNQLGELTAANLNNVGYSYASVWKYNVNNLLMKHHLTITRTRPNEGSTQTLYIFYEQQDKTFNSPVYGRNITGIIEGGKGDGGLTVYDKNKTLIKNINILDIDSERISLYNIFKKDENGKYHNINGNDGIFSISSSDLMNPNKNYYYWHTNWKSYASESPFTIFDNTTYDLMEYNICAFLDNGDRCNKEIMINEPIIARFDGKRYTVANANDPSDTFDVYFKLYDENSKKFILNPDFTLQLCGLLPLSLDTEEMGEIVIYTNLISGEVSDARKSDEIVEVSSAKAHISYLQLTQTVDEPRKPAIDDLLLYNDNGKLTITTPILKNEIHNIDLSNNDKITISPMYWMNTSTTHKGNITPKCFVPIRNTRPLNSYFARNHYNNSGFFYITDLNGNTPDDLIDDKSNVFLATGHETLNIDKVGIDDNTFKTFNGTIMFDRSNSKITRLFSNDLETGLLGYISDLLAAKLSRYYFVCDYNSFDMFMNTNTNLTIPTNKRGLLRGYQNQDNIYTQPHIITLSSCEDIIKLVGSENVINNIMPNICPEEHAMNTALIKDSELYNINDDLKLNMFYYKIFHYYSSSLDNMPYIGLNANDDSTGKTTIGGVSLVSIDKNAFMKPGTSHAVGDLKPTEDMIYIVNKINAIKNKIQGSKDITANTNYYSNKYNIIDKYGFNCVLPVSRIYRNANIEHTDLTITTGGIKTLHPVYLQVVNRTTLNNLLYMIDDILINNKEGFFDDLFMYFRVYNLVSSTASTLPTDPNNAFVLYRLAQEEFSSRATGNTAKYYVANSFDTLFILNYHNYNNVNDYYNANDEVESLYNEELVWNMESSSLLNNIQLFSMKRFDYFDIIEKVKEKAFITWVQSYVQGVDISNNVAVLYVDELEEKQKTEKEFEQLNEYVSDFIMINENLLNGRNRFNKLKVVNVLLLKLGEILDHPAILYGVCYDYKNSNNIKVLFNNEIYTPTQNYRYDNTNTAYNIDSPVIPKQIYSPIDEKYKTNTYLFGVMYRYHQSAKGYVRADNELSDTFTIERSQGVKTFEIVLYDEFGRKIPNTDTSQGFNNNLLLELTIKPAMTAGQQGI